jgi:hypothetical protein
MGRVAFERGNLESSLAYYRRALALKPDLADVHNNIGNVLKELGQLDEAQKSFLEAIRLDPNVTGVYVNLADSMKFSPGDPHLAAMEAIAAKTEGLSKTDRIHLDFALGKAYADLKDYPRSFKHLVEGNAGKRATIAYDETSALALFDRIEAVFTRELIAAKSGGGDESPMPIFVLGMPRSGTTLIEQIIASHPGARRRRTRRTQRGRAHRTATPSPTPSSCRRSMRRRLGKSARATSPRCASSCPSTRKRAT